MHESRPDGDPIEPRLRRAFEHVLHCDLSSVRVARDPAIAAMGALAAAQGEQIRLSPHAPSLATPQGVAVLGHELAHVLQQRSGRAQLPDGGVRLDDPVLEAEADGAGLHCASQIHPGSIRDPGPPPGLRPAPATFTPAPLQFIVSAKTSFDDFLATAWNYLVQEEGGPGREVSVATVLRGLYTRASAATGAPKMPLTGAPLCTAMAAFIGNTYPLSCTMQKNAGAWPNLTPYVRNLQAAYREMADGRPVVPGSPVEAEALAGLHRTYLHVFPPRPAPRSDWRIALNVIPEDVPKAVELLRPLMQRSTDIYDIKFLAPGIGVKCDSALVYIDKKPESFAALKQDILNVAAQLRLQPCVGRMWDEIADGVGEAAEPPSDPMLYMSFTDYRILLVYLSFWFYRTVRGPNTFEGFCGVVRLVMGLFGLDFDRPQLQGPVSQTLFGENEFYLDAYRVFKAIRDGKWNYQAGRIEQ